MERSVLVFKSDLSDGTASHFRFTLFRRCQQITIVRECQNFFEVLGDEYYLNRIYNRDLLISK